MSSGGPSPVIAVPSQDNSSQSSGLPQPGLLIGVAIGAIALAILGISTVLLYLWRRGVLRGQSNNGAAAQVSKAEEDRSVFALRKPVVIINPSEESMYFGRKESCYFPSFFRLGRRSTDKDKVDTLQDPAEGGYYTQGAPGFFEVDLEMGSQHAKDVSKGGTSTTTDSSIHSSQFSAPSSLEEVDLDKPAQAASKTMP